MFSLSFGITHAREKLPFYLFFVKNNFRDFCRFAPISREKLKLMNRGDNFGLFGSRVSSLDFEKNLSKFAVLSHKVGHEKSFSLILNF